MFFSEFSFVSAEMKYTLVCAKPTIKLLSAGEPDTNNCPLGLHERVTTGECPA